MCGRVSIGNRINFSVHAAAVYMPRAARPLTAWLTHAHTGSANNASRKSIHLVELSARLQSL